MIPAQKDGKFWIYNQQGTLVYFYNPVDLAATRGGLSASQYAAYEPYPISTDQGPRVILWNKTNHLLSLNPETGQINDLFVNLTPPQPGYMQVSDFVPGKLGFWKDGSFVLRQ